MLICSISEFRMVCFMGDVNNFAANNIVSLDEIKDKFTSEK
jgi:hypothetical protein